MEKTDESRLFDRKNLNSWKSEIQQSTSRKILSRFHVGIISEETKSLDPESIIKWALSYSKCPSNNVRLRLFRLERKLRLFKEGIPGGSDSSDSDHDEESPSVVDSLIEQFKSKPISVADNTMASLSLELKPKKVSQLIPGQDYQLKLQRNLDLLHQKMSNEFSSETTSNPQPINNIISSSDKSDLLQLAPPPTIESTNQLKIIQSLSPSQPTSLTPTKSSSIVIPPSISSQPIPHDKSPRVLKQLSSHYDNSNPTPTPSPSHSHTPLMMMMSGVDNNIQSKESNTCIPLSPSSTSPSKPALTHINPNQMVNTSKTKEIHPVDPSTIRIEEGKDALQKQTRKKEEEEEEVISPSLSSHSLSPRPPLKSEKPSSSRPSFHSQLPSNSSTPPSIISTFSTAINPPPDTGSGSGSGHRSSIFLSREQRFSIVMNTASGILRDAKERVEAEVFNPQTHNHNTHSNQNNQHHKSQHPPNRPNSSILHHQLSSPTSFPSSKQSNQYQSNGDIDPEEEDDLFDSPPSLVLESPSPHPPTIERRRTSSLSSSSSPRLSPFEAQIQSLTQKASSSSSSSSSSRKPSTLHGLSGASGSVSLPSPSSSSQHLPHLPTTNNHNMSSPKKSVFFFDHSDLTAESQQQKEANVTIMNRFFDLVIPTLDIEKPILNENEETEYAIRYFVSPIRTINPQFVPLSEISKDMQNPDLTIHRPFNKVEIDVLVAQRKMAENGSLRYSPSEIVHSFRSPEMLQVEKQFIDPFNSEPITRIGRGVEREMQQIDQKCAEQKERTRAMLEELSNACNAMRESKSINTERSALENQNKRLFQSQTLTRRFKQTNSVLYKSSRSDQIEAIAKEVEKNRTISHSNSPRSYSSRTSLSNRNQINSISSTFLTESSVVITSTLSSSSPSPMTSKQQHKEQEQEVIDKQQEQKESSGTKNNSFNQFSFSSIIKSKNKFKSLLIKKKDQLSDSSSSSAASDEMASQSESSPNDDPETPPMTKKKVEFSLDDSASSSSPDQLSPSSESSTPTDEPQDPVSDPTEGKSSSSHSLSPSKEKNQSKYQSHEFILSENHKLNSISKCNRKLSRRENYRILLQGKNQWFLSFLTSIRRIYYAQHEKTLSELKEGSSVSVGGGHLSIEEGGVELSGTSIASSSSISTASSSVSAPVFMFERKKRKPPLTTAIPLPYPLCLSLDVSSVSNLQIQNDTSRESSDPDCLLSSSVSLAMSPRAIRQQQKQLERVKSQVPPPPSPHDHQLSSLPSNKHTLQMNSISSININGTQSVYLPPSLYVFLSAVERVLVMRLNLSSELIWRLADETLSRKELGIQFLFNLLAAALKSVGVSSQEIFKAFKERRGF